VCSLVIGAHSLSINAFVVRCPDENAAGVHRGCSSATPAATPSATPSTVEATSTSSAAPLHAVTAEEVDRTLGSVHALADGAFNALLELGFATAIRKEWAWRTSRGESTANLAAFHHLVQPAGSGTPGGAASDAQARSADAAAGTAADMTLTTP
jgi:hypothetical protein